MPTYTYNGVAYTGGNVAVTGAGITEVLSLFLPSLAAQLTPELQERVKFPQDQLDRLVQLDHEFMSDRRADWTQRWNRVVAGG